MAGRIPQSFIDELVSRADIVEIIDERVPLKRAGRDFIACCPFHEEKTPSFSVSPAKQFYHCFGCGAHGTAIGFLIEYAHMEFPEAVEELAARVGLEVPRESEGRETRGEASELYEGLTRASTYYQQQLRKHPDAGTAVQYLKKRGLTKEITARFCLGFAPPSWDGLLREMGGSPHRKRMLVECGLAIPREAEGHYDRFRNRIMFPIHDRRGRVVGFGARALGDETPKYLNSPETAVFHKGRELYGFHEAREANRHLDRFVVVEGYMDVVTLAQAGVSNAVATLGTAPSPDHMQRLFRTTPRVVFCFDGDSAGRRAAWRAAEVLAPLIKDGWLASFAFLPDGEDPDSLVRTKGREALDTVLGQSISLSTFLFEHWSSEVDLGDLEGRARLVELARPLLAKLNAPALQKLAIHRLSDLTGMSGSELSKLIGEGEGVPVRQIPNERGRHSSRGRSNPSLVRKTISLLLHSPRLGLTIESPRRLGVLVQPGAQLLVELLELLSATPTLTTGAIIEHFRGREEGRHLAKLAAEEPPLLGEGLEREFADAVEKLEALVDEQRFTELAQKARSKALTREEEREFSQLVKRPASGRGTAHPLAHRTHPSGEGVDFPTTKLPPN